MQTHTQKTELFFIHFYTYNLYILVVELIILSIF